MAITVLALTMSLLVIYSIKAVECSSKSKGCDFCSNISYNAGHSQLIFDSVDIVNDSLEIEFDIKVTKYCYSCTIMHIPNVISLSINSKYNIFQITVHNMNGDNTIVNWKNSIFPNADILLPTDNKYHHIYLSKVLLSSNSLYNQNILKIDNFERYYGGSTLPTNSNHSYTLFVGNTALQFTDILDASIKNICVNSPVPIKAVNNIHDGELRCGDIKYGTLTFSEKIDYYYFQLTHTSDVIFDTCHSSPEIYIDFHTIAGDKISGIWQDNCSPGVQLMIPSLAKGRYIVQMGADADIKNKRNIYQWSLMSDRK